MGLTFLAPLFLAGLAALAVPVLVHLTHRERKDAVPFPSLMFLRRVPYRTVRRQRIRHWLLFALRLAAVTLLVAAFARPLLDRATLGPTVIGDAREVVVLLDRSFSMGYRDRWDRARAAAQRAIDELRPDDRGTIVFFADRPEVANQPSADRGALKALLDGAQPGFGVTRFGPALRLARDLLESSELPRRELVLVTDFQRAGWESEQDLELPSGTTITTVDLSAAQWSNLAVTDVVLDRSVTAGANRVRVSARVVNAGARLLEAVPVSLEVAGQRVERRTVSVAAQSSVTVQFGGVTLPSRTVPGRVLVAADALPYDDAYHFTVAPVRALPMLLVEDAQAGAGGGLFVRRALAVGFDPPFAVSRKRVTELRPADLEGQALIVLDDAPFPRGAAGRRLGEYVREGGGLLVILGPRSGPGAWPAETVEWLGTPGVIADRIGGRGAALSVLDYGHPVFAPFSAPHTGDFSSARFFRYRRYEPPTAASTLARYDDGAVALAELRIGAGGVLVWTSPLDNLWSDFPVQPVFLPFVHESVRHLARYRSEPLGYEVGQVVDLAVDRRARPWGVPRASARAADLVVETPEGARTVARPGADGRPDPLRLREPGFYTIRSIGDAEGDARIIAANVDPAESDLTPMDPEELHASIAPREASANRVATLAARLTPVEKERRQSLWWYLLLAVLLVFLAETVVADRLSPATRGPS